MSTITFRRGARVATVCDSPANLRFVSGHLSVHDCVDGGATKDVQVHIALDESWTYVRTVVPLRKFEFEEIFGFAPGQFVKGRVVRSVHEDVRVVLDDDED